MIKSKLINKHIVLSIILAGVIFIIGYSYIKITNDGSLIPEEAIIIANSIEIFKTEEKVEPLLTVENKEKAEELSEDNIKKEVITYSSVDKKNDSLVKASDEVGTKAEEISQKQLKPLEGKTPQNPIPIIDPDRHIVAEGDSLYLISQKYGLAVETIKKINNLTNDRIVIGQILSLTEATNKTVVSRGNGREDDIFWLSRIIHAEAQGEPYRGKIAVGNVVLNRVKSQDFPNTIYGVIFDRQYGYVQFSPVIDGSIYNNPCKECIQAAVEALNGERPVGDVLYFLNPRKATNFWIVANRKFYMTIGDHDFYH